MTAANKLTPKRRKTFLGHLSELGSVKHACELVAVSREAVYKLRAKDKKFAKAWEDAVELASDALEDEARRRAVEGWEEPLKHEGRLTGDVITKFSDTLLIFLLKGNKPEKFAERHKLDGAIRTENTVIYLPENNR